MQPASKTAGDRVDRHRKRWKSARVAKRAIHANFSLPMERLAVLAEPFKGVLHVCREIQDHARIWELIGDLETKQGKRQISP